MQLARLTPEEKATVQELLEESQIRWRRDWDAVLFGMFMGVLVGVMTGIFAATLLLQP